MLLKQNLITEMNLVIGQQPQQKRNETTTFVEEMGEDVEVVQEGKEGGVVEDSKVNVDLILKKRSVLESLSKFTSVSLSFCHLLQPPTHPSGPPLNSLCFVNLLNVLFQIC